ncbi:hyaluronan mediated motility receptor [Synchiropus splendidus]|uniref:hyaluronan mediated motility receptor n=1 Tax=Synchiropus splendidus TaxID=270530 RepID=UPI00237D676E|nr:hyaluronan mediated motility receptor [Synchiropus splendidus]
MSFSRAPLKRFNEHVGCAPPPGIYEIKPGEPKGAASFDKSDRFKPPKAVAASSVAPPPPPSPSRPSLVSPVRRTLSVDVLVEESSVKKGKQSMTLEKKLQIQLENEIRTLVQQRGEQDRRLLTVEEELKKVEAKLLASIRERTALTANVQTLERQQAELKKVNEFLKNKVSADATKKKINSLTMDLMEARNNLDSKTKELTVLQVNTQGRLKSLEGDLRSAKETITSLEEKQRDLKDLHQVTKNINDELESENTRLQAVVQELREEVRVLQGYLDTANEEIQDLRTKVEKSSAADLQQDRIAELETELEKRLTELVTNKDLLSQKKGEASRYQQDLEESQQALLKVEQQMEEKELTLKRSQDSVMDLEEQLRAAKQDVLDSQEAVAKQEEEVAGFREALRRTEQELDERVAHLEQRCILSEEERSRAQEEGLRRVEQLQTELNQLMETNNDVQERRVQLEQQHVALTEELAKEKALADSLSVLMDQERQDSEEKFQQLHDELEEVLGELSLMEDTDQRRLQALERLQKQKEDLEKELCDVKELLNKRNTDVSALKDKHSSALMDLQDAHSKSLSQMEVVLAELGSTKTALSAAEEKQNSLAVEVERLKQQRKEMDEVIVQKEEAIKRVTGDLEEQQRRLMEEREAWAAKAELVQSRLAEKEDKRRAAEESHATLIGQLQQKLQLHTVEKEAALEQIEELKGQLRDGVKMQQQVALLSQEKVTLQWQMEEQRQELQQQLTQAQEASCGGAETEHWRSMYEVLLAKVKPFQEQLDSFAAERNALLNENGANQDELNKLADAYARLLGHQNQRQKIKHVMKLKDENMGLKQELCKLRTLLKRQKCDLDQMKEKLPGAPRRRFDPSKAFQHDKENVKTPGPLKEGNLCV